MNSIKLTKSAVGSIAYPSSGQAIYWDTLLPAFGVKVGKKTKTYIVQRDLNGRDTLRSIGRDGLWTPETARQQAKEWLLLMSKGIDPKESIRNKRRTQRTFQDAYEEYLNEKRKKIKKRTLRNYEDHFKNHLQPLKKKVFNEIKSADLIKLHEEIADRCGDHAAKHAMSFVSSIFRYMQIEDETLQNPVEVLKRKKILQKPVRRKTYIHPSELGNWYSAVNRLGNDTVKDALILCLFTGLRKMELLCLKWENINFNARLVKVPNTKNGSDFIFPMSNYVHDLLKRRFDARCGEQWVFPGNGKQGNLTDPKRACERVQRISGIKFMMHDLRRTFATIAEDKVSSAYSVKRLLNHKGGDVTGGYIMTDMIKFAREVEVVSQYIESLLINMPALMQSKGAEHIYMQIH